MQLKYWWNTFPLYLSNDNMFSLPSMHRGFWWFFFPLSNRIIPLLTFPSCNNTNKTALMAKRRRSGPSPIKEETF